MATKIPSSYIKNVTHHAACNGADATERAIVICFSAKVPAKRAGEMIGMAANLYAGEKMYSYLELRAAAVNA